MITKLLLFDLDDTLLPTESLLNYRHSKEILELSDYEEYQKINPYDGILKMLDELYFEIRIGLVTSSPKWYVDQILSRYFEKFRFNPLVTFNDVTELKPNPEPLRLALYLANVKSLNTIYVGNAKEDFLASSKAKVTFIGAGWSSSKSFPLDACPNVETPEQLKKVILNSI